MPARRFCLCRQLENEMVEHRAEELVWNAGNKPMQNVAWIFAGSKIVNIFMANNNALCLQHTTLLQYLTTL